MKTLILSAVSFAVLGLAGCSQASAPDPGTSSPTAAPVVQDANMETRTKAVLVYADWCGSCKVLDPKVKKVKAAGAVSGIEYVTLDYTDKNPENFFAQAEAAGVKMAVKDYRGDKVKTGQLLLVDLDDQKVIGKVTKSLDHAEIIAALQEAVNAS
ncbi:MAG: thioredoxin domain-containing protein [Maricaulaceae bacterium]